MDERTAATESVPPAASAVGVLMLSLALSLCAFSCVGPLTEVRNESGEPLRITSYDYEPIEHVLQRDDSQPFPGMAEEDPCRFTAHDLDGNLVAELDLDEECGTRRWTITPDGSTFE